MYITNVSVYIFIPCHSGCYNAILLHNVDTRDITIFIMQEQFLFCEIGLFMLLRELLCTLVHFHSMLNSDQCYATEC